MLISSKNATLIQIIIAVVSAISIGIATWITTLQIPIVQVKIANEDSIIKELKYQTTKDLVQGLYAMDLHTDRRLDLIDICLEQMMNKSRTKLKESLLKEVMDKTSDQILRWNSMFILERRQSTNTTLPPVDPNTPIEQKILTLDRALVQARKDAYSRLDELIHQVNKHELQKAGYYNTLKPLETRFRFFQMIGLLTLVVAVTIEALKKLKCKRLDESAIGG